MTNAKIHLCFECGQKNRVPEGGEASALCGSCGKKLYPNLQKPVGTNKQAVPATNQGESKNKSDRKPIWTLVVVAMILVPIGMLMASNQGSSSSPTNYTSPTYPTSVQPASTQYVAEEPPFTDAPELIFPGLVWNETGRDGEAPFQILSHAGTNHFVKLVEFPTGADAVAIFVRGGSTVEVDIPFGTYKMRWCSGTTWYGEDNRFGPDEQCSTSNELFKFWINGNYAEGHTVTLYRAVGGNMTVNNLDPDAF